jgi:hypothetical protein
MPATGEQRLQLAVLGQRLGTPIPAGPLNRGQVDEILRLWRARAEQSPISTP